MRAKRGAVAAVLALGLAVVPGLVRHADTGTGTAAVDRALPSPTTFEPPGGDTVMGDVAITAPAEFVGAAPAALPATATFGPATRTGGTFALVVGVNDYPGDDHDLAAASGDAALLDQALDGFGVPKANRVLLRDGQATAGAIKAALRQLAASGDAGSTLVFSFAGHARKLDHDTEELIAADGASITDAELASLLRPAVAEHVWLMLDSCYSAGFTEAMGPGRVLTASAPADHISYENHRLRASYLSHFLVRKAWLEGRGGRSVQEAFAYADAAIAREYPNRRPVEIDQSGTPIVLGPGSPKTSTPVVPPPPPRAKPAPSRTPTTSPPPPPADPPTEIRDCDLVVFCKD